MKEETLFSPGRVRETVTLENLEFKLPKLGTEQKPGNTSIEEFDVVFNNIPVRVSILSHSFFDTDRRELAAKTTISVSLSSSLDRSAIIFIDIKQLGKELYEGKTNVINFDSSQKPKTERQLQGIGRALWELSLKIIQRYADALKSQVVHTVQRDPIMGLDDEKWEELFLPLLRKYGYKRSGVDTWEKTYLPEEE